MKPGLHGAEICCEQVKMGSVGALEGWPVESPLRHSSGTVAEACGLKR